jgi:D-sedoheptulose 7-phosphate isomerase
MSKLKEQIQEIQELCSKLILDEEFLNTLDKTVHIISEMLMTGHTVFACGNGGSYSTASHLTEELVGRYRSNRKPLPAVCLGADPAAITCIANDYSFEDIFSREFEALAKKDDCLIVFSTSGNSPNLLKVLDTARSKECLTIGILGKDGGKAKSYCDHLVIVPHNSAARIQEIHTFILHAICENLENSFNNE